MNLNKTYKICIIFLILVLSKLTQATDVTNNKHNIELLNAFHKFGITKCDKFITQNSPLRGNWHYTIDRSKSKISEDIKEVTLIRILGKNNDTVKLDDSYIQTSKGCALHSRSTVTFAGPCSKNVDLDYWYVTNELRSHDYTEYSNNGGILLLAKEITVGNFKACIMEYKNRSSETFD